MVTRKDVLFFHDNAWHHLVRVARDTIGHLTRRHCAINFTSPELEPKAYHLYHSLDSNFRGKSFTTELVDNCLKVFAYDTKVAEVLTAHIYT